jgi:hypothetical protein
LALTPVTDKCLDVLAESPAPQTILHQLGVRFMEIEYTKKRKHPIPPGSHSFSSGCSRPSWGLACRSSATRNISPRASENPIPDLHCRKNGRLFRLKALEKADTPLAPRFEVLEVNGLEEQG